MSPYQYAKTLENEYLEAKQAFQNATIVVNLTELENTYKINYNDLKKEVESLGYKLELAKDLNNYWKKQWNIFPQAVFFNDASDL